MESSFHFRKRGPNSRGILPKKPSTLPYSVHVNALRMQASREQRSTLLYFEKIPHSSPRDNGGTSFSTIHPRAISRPATTPGHEPMKQREECLFRSGQRFNKLQSSSQRSFDLSRSRRGETRGEEERRGWRSFFSLGGRTISGSP